jgi:hypothetical protein
LGAWGRRIEFEANLGYIVSPVSKKKKKKKEKLSRIAYGEMMNE